MAFWAGMSMVARTVPVGLILEVDGDVELGAGRLDGPDPIAFEVFGDGGAGGGQLDLGVARCA